MAILDTVRSWWARRRRHEHEEYDDSYGRATPDEMEQLDDVKHPMRNRLKILATGGMPDGTGMSPTGTPIDFTADEKPPRH